MRLRRTATRGGKEEEDKRRKEGRENLLTADFSTSEGGVGGGFSFVFLQRWHRKPSCAAGKESAERKGGGETRGNRKLMGK